MIWHLADYAIESAVVLLIGLGAARILGRGSAAIRHSCWTAALSITLLLGPLSLLSPLLGLPIYPAIGASAVTTRAPRAGASAIEFLTMPTAVDDASRLDSRTLGATTPRATHHGVVFLILGGWLSGTLLLLFQVVRSRIRLGRLRRDATVITDTRVRLLLDEVARKVGVKCVVELLSSGALPTPVVFGTWRPVIVLPAGAESWSEDRLRAVLAHELAHVRRRDPLTQLMAELVRSIHWYNPLTWLAANHMATERERACDDEVVRTGMRATDYADHLLALARLTVRPHVRARGALAMTAAAGLTLRVKALVEPVPSRARVTGVQRTLVVALAAAVLCVLSAIGGTRSHADGGVVLTQEVSSPSATSLEDPRSEWVELVRPRELWPDEHEIEAAPERDAILRLRAAAEHHKTSASDLVRERAEWALTRVQEGRITAPLESDLDDADWRIRAYAAWSLATIDGREAIPSLQRLLDDRIWRVRAQAAASLLQLQATPTPEILERLATDSAWQVRICAVEFYQRRNDPKARVALERMRDDPHAGTRMTVEAALSR